MTTVDTLDFKEYYPNRYNATFKHKGLVLSVSYGAGMYGSGPTENGDGSYEIALWREGCDDWIQLTEGDTVAAWQPGDRVNSLIHDIQNGVYDRA